MYHFFDRLGSYDRDATILKLLALSIDLYHTANKANVKTHEKQVYLLSF